jgi:GTP-binding protein
LSKADLVTPSSLAAKKRALEKASGVPVYIVSAATRQGVDEVLDALIAIAGHVAGEKQAEPQAWTPL